MKTLTLLLFLALPSLVLADGFVPQPGGGGGGSLTPNQTVTANTAVTNAVPTNSASVSIVSQVLNLPNIINGVFNVTNYGAVGDGVHNDYAAFTNTIWAASLWGGTRIVVPHPSKYYLVNGTITNNVPGLWISGDGQAGDSDGDGITNMLRNAGTVIMTANQGIPLFLCTTNAGKFSDLSIENTNAIVTTPGASFICCSNNVLWSQKIDIQNCTFFGGYNQVEQHSGSLWNIGNCLFLNPHNYGLFVENKVSSDAGDAFIHDSVLIARNWAAAGGIYTQGSIIGTALKLNGGFGSTAFTNSIEIDAPTGVATSNVKFSNCSIENYYNAGIHSGNSSGGTIQNLSLTDIQFLCGGANGNPIQLNGHVGDNCIISHIIARAMQSPFGNSVYAVVELGDINNASVSDIQGYTDSQDVGHALIKSPSLYTFNRLTNDTYIGNITISYNSSSGVTFNGFQDNETCVNSSASTIGSLTITLPSVSYPGQSVTYFTHGIVTSCTVSGTVVGASLTAMTANQTVRFVAQDWIGGFVRVQ